MPLLWAMSPQQQADMQQGQKTLLFSYNMHLFLPYLLNDSQTILSMIHFSKPLLCMLICGDWSDDCWSTACNLCRKWKAHQHYWILQHFTQQHEQTTWLQFYLINSSLSPSCLWTWKSIKNTTGAGPFSRVSVNIVYGTLTYTHDSRITNLFRCTCGNCTPPSEAENLKISLPSQCRSQRLLDMMLSTGIWYV